MGEATTSRHAMDTCESYVRKGAPSWEIARSVKNLIRKMQLGVQKQWAGGGRNWCRNAN